jgi:hypothetical protein
MLITKSVKNSLSNSKFQALHESKHFTPRKCNLWKLYAHLGAKIDPFFDTGILTSIVVHESSLAAT